MPFVLVFAVIAGAGGLIVGALAAPLVDPQRCMGTRDAAWQPEEGKPGAEMGATTPIAEEA